MHDPRLGRFLSTDPLADHPNQWDKSTYAYAWDNPVFYNDPDGKCPTCPTMFLGGLIGAAVGLYDLSQQHGGFSNAIGKLADGDGQAWSQLAVSTGTGVALGSGVGVLGAMGISGGGNVISQTIQNDGDISKIDPVQAATATVMGGVGAGGGKIIEKALKPITSKASGGVNIFVEKVVIPKNSPAVVLGAEAGVVLSTTVAEKVTNSVTKPKKESTSSDTKKQEQKVSTRTQGNGFTPAFYHEDR